MASTLGTPLPRKRFGHAYIFIALVVAAITALRAWSGGGSWLVPALALGVAAFFYLLPWISPRGRENVQVDDDGVIVVYDQRKEEVRWPEITRVRILTTDSGPWVEDVFFVLDGIEGKGCVVPHDAAVRTGLLEEIQARLHGVNDQKVIEAMGCTSNNVFIIWEKQNVGAG